MSHVNGALAKEEYKYYVLKIELKVSKKWVICGLFQMMPKNPVTEDVNAKRSTAMTNEQFKKLKDDLWASADQLRANSGLKSTDEAKYK